MSKDIEFTAIPSGQKTAQSMEDRQPKTSGQGSQGIVLCVDDDTTVLNALRTLLGKTLGGNIMVEIAESGQEALEICAELKEDGKEVSVVISDFIMPSMRGDELLIRIHEKNPRTIKIMLTGQSDLQGIKRTINEANLYRFLEKPFNNADLMLTTRSALQTYSKERDLERQLENLRKANAELERQLAEKNK